MPKFILYAISIGKEIISYYMHFYITIIINFIIIIIFIAILNIIIPLK